MLTGLTIKNFRGIQSLSIRGLAPVTLLTGDNGAGKTTVLEAVLALYGKMNPLWLMNLQALRGFGVLSEEGPNYAGLFWNYADVGSASVAGTLNGETWKVVLRRSTLSAGLLSRAPKTSTDAEVPHAPLVCLAYENNRLVNRSYIMLRREASKAPEIHALRGKPNRYQAVLLHPAEHSAGEEERRRFGDTRVSGRAQALIKALSDFDARVQDVEFVDTSKGRYFLAKLDHGQGPLGVLGGGINKVFRYFVNLDYARGGFVGIDEVENGIHHSRLEKLFEHLFAFAKATHTQLMLTTHSADALAAILRVGEKTPGRDLAVVHLRRERDNSIRAKLFNEVEAVKSAQLGYDLR